MGIALESTAAFTAALGHAHEIALSSYTLHGGAVLNALVAAARAGADVHVRLERDPLEAPGGKLHRDNAASIAALRAAGADARSSAPGEPQVHTKAAIVDGVAWLDDRNFAGTSNECIVRVDDPASVATTKADALAREADVIDRAGAARLDLESESFGAGSIYHALVQRAQAHLPTRVLVAGRELQHNAREQTCLARLAALGVEVRTGDARGRDLNEKLAVSATAAWLGSANATYAGGTYGAQSEWGIATRDARVVDGVRAAFDRNWALARPPARTATEVIRPGIAQ